MTRPVFNQFCVTIPAVVNEDDGVVMLEARNWYGIEEVRKRSWGVTHHPVREFRTEKKWTDAEFHKKVIGVYTFRIADMHAAEQARQVRDAESYFEQLDKLTNIALAEIDAMVKEAKL